MEWVEITGRTVEEAKDSALDQLGVDTDDAEFEILEEPSRGIFGKMKGQARVRARIRPTRPRAKVERRDRRGRRPGGGGGNNRSREAKSETKNGSRDKAPAETAPAAEATDTPLEATASSNGKRPRRSGGSKAETATKEATDMIPTVDVDLVEHTRIVTEFLDGLVDAFDLEGRVTVESIDEDTNEVRIEGRDLGILVGPKGNTLSAIQELSRTVVHRKVSGSAEGRIRLDVAGYRQRRREALEVFTRQVAEEVLSAGVQKALEPMGAADRKVVHDTANGIDGVSTLSEGDEPRRRVVIVPS